MPKFRMELHHIDGWKDVTTILSLKIKTIDAALHKLRKRNGLKLGTDTRKYTTYLIIESKANTNE